MVVTADAPLVHGGLKLLVEGQVTLQLSARSIGLFEAFSSALKPIPLVHTEIEVNAGGSKVPKGSTPFPFEFVLRALPGQQLFDTYHGVYINCQYTLNATMVRGMMQRPVTKQKEILVETQAALPPADTSATTTPGSTLAAAISPTPPTGALKGPLSFQVSPSSLQNIKESNKRKGRPIKALSSALSLSRSPPCYPQHSPPCSLVCACAGCSAQQTNPIHITAHRH